MIYKRIVEIRASQEGSVPDWIHLLSVGHYDTQKYGPLDITAEALSEMVANIGTARFNMQN